MISSARTRPARSRQTAWVVGVKVGAGSGVGVREGSGREVTAGVGAAIGGSSRAQALRSDRTTKLRVSARWDGISTKPRRPRQCAGRRGAPVGTSIGRRRARVKKGGMWAIETSTPVGDEIQCLRARASRAGREPPPERDGSMRQSQQLRTPDFILICLIGVQLASLAAALKPLVAESCRAPGVLRQIRGPASPSGSVRGLSPVRRCFGAARWPRRGPSDRRRLDLRGCGLDAVLLFPREIVNCPAGADLPGCVLSMVGQRTYILRVGDFPAPENVPASKAYSPFAVTLGLDRPR